MDPYGEANDSAAVLSKLSGRDTHRVAIVLGSGWSDAAAVLVREGSGIESIGFEKLGGFPPPSVPGHSGKVLSLELSGTNVLVFLGRVHLYEGHAPETVVHGVRTACAAGCRTIVLTNAAGALNPDYSVSDIVLIRDHLNLQATSPLLGAAGAGGPGGHGGRFVDLSDLYSARLRQVVQGDPATFAEGVYAALLGPQYETPAEIGMLRGFGADLVGMSTALEAIAARHLGAEVLGLSLVTNAAAGIGHSVDHGEVLAAGAAAATGVGALLARIVGRLR